jgi:hypothetical protein
MISKIGKIEDPSVGLTCQLVSIMDSSVANLSVQMDHVRGPPVSAQLQVQLQSCKHNSGCGCATLTLEMQL